jgi:hypothetical protein
MGCVQLGGRLLLRLLLLLLLLLLLPGAAVHAQTPAWGAVPVLLLQHLPQLLLLLLQLDLYWHYQHACRGVQWEDGFNISCLHHHQLACQPAPAGRELWKQSPSTIRASSQVCCFVLCFRV